MKELVEVSLFKQIMLLVTEKLFFRQLVQIVPHNFSLMEQKDLKPLVPE
jgi:hypothetical protein